MNPGRFGPGSFRPGSFGPILGCVVLVLVGGWFRVIFEVSSFSLVFFWPKSIITIKVLQGQIGDVMHGRRF